MNPVRLLEVSNSVTAPTPVDPSAFQTSGTKVLFLGGLLHLNNLGLTTGLSKILHDLTPEESSRKNKKKVFTLTLGQPENISQLVGEIYQVANEQREKGIIPVTDNAHRIIQEVILPPKMQAAWKALPLHQREEEAKTYFNGLKLIGYSYGTSLVQQLDRGLREALKPLDLPPSTLSAVGSLNIGPVVRPLEDGAFRQLFVFRKADKVMDSAIQRHLIKNPEQDYDAYSVGQTLCVGEYCGDDMLRHVSIGKFPSGDLSPKVIFQLDGEGHDLRLYTNVPQAVPGKEACNYPSSAFGLILREAGQEMLSTDPDWSFKRTTILSSFLSPTSSVVAKRSAKKWMGHWQRKFADVVEKYRDSGFDESIDYLRGEIAAMPTARRKGLSPAKG